MIKSIREYLKIRALTKFLIKEWKWKKAAAEAYAKQVVRGF